ncbi:MAG: lytic transglycosylase domain-containing protein [Nitrospiraceae bacterium]
MKNTTTPYRESKRLCGSVEQGLCAALVVGVVVFMPPTATSELYQYVERNGTVNVTNVPTDQRYQSAPYDSTYLSSRVSKKELEQAIAWYAKRYRLHPALLRAVIKAESDFVSTAVSRRGALGLMQLMPRTAASLRVRDPFNPIDNIAGGAKHLRYLLNRFNGNLPLALAAYNAGEYRVKQYQQIPPIQETRYYVQKVLRYYHAFRSGKGQPPTVRSAF